MLGIGRQAAIELLERRARLRLREQEGTEPIKTVRVGGVRREQLLVAPPRFGGVARIVLQAGAAIEDLGCARKQRFGLHVLAARFVGRPARFSSAARFENAGSKLGLSSPAAL